MRYSTEDCLALFDTSPGGQLEKGWADGVLCQRTKTTQAGPMVYCASLGRASASGIISPAITAMMTRKARYIVSISV